MRVPRLLGLRHPVAPDLGEVGLAMTDCSTPAGGIHRCQVADDAEAAAVNVAALARFANPALLPPYAAGRRQAILGAWVRAIRPEIGRAHV